MHGRCGVMTGILFRVQVDAGGADIGVPQVVTHHLQISILAKMASCGMAHPVRRGLLNVGCGYFKLRPLLAKPGCTGAEYAFDDFMNATAGHGFAGAYDWNDQGGCFLPAVEADIGRMLYGR